MTKMSISTAVLKAQIDNRIVEMDDSMDSLTFDLLTFTCSVV